MYNAGGLIKTETYEGNAYGMNVNFGYALMLGKHWNMELGLGAFWGVTDYKKYSCPKCGKTIKEDKKWFVSPDNVLIQFVYVF